MSDAGTRFGVDVNSQFSQWWNEGGREEFKRRFGATDFYALILDPAARADYSWTDPRQSAILEVSSAAPGKEEEAPFKTFNGPSLARNVVGKLRYVIRVQEDSVHAETHPDLVEPADFPYEGGLRNYRGYTGALSGFDKVVDVAALMWLINKYIEFRAAAANRSLEDAADRVDGRKYLGGDPLDEEYVPRWEPYPLAEPLRRPRWDTTDVPSS